MIIGKDIALAGNEDPAAANGTAGGHTSKGHLTREGTNHGYNRRADFLDSLSDGGIDLGGIYHQCGALALGLGLAFIAGIQRNCDRGG